MGFLDIYKMNSPGPGVPKDGKPKSGFKLFFDIFIRKFGSLMKVNLLFFLFNLPAIFLLTIVSQLVFAYEIPGDQTASLTSKFILSVIGICIPLVTVGPAQAGFTYVLRNFAREEHAFVWGDFKDHALKNLRQSAIVCLIDLIVVSILGFGLSTYVKMAASSFPAQLASAFLMFAIVLFLMMHMYIYPIMVTFKLSIKQIYKNALIFSIAKFIPNLLILVLCAILVYVPFFYNPYLAFILLALMTFSMIGLIINIFVYNYLKKYMMDQKEQAR
jgi:uncharacterized membrane protein YesL